MTSGFIALRPASVNTSQPLVQSPSEGAFLGRSTAAELQLSAAFSLEQRRVALGIWPPLLLLLRPALHELTRLDCTLTPNGLIIESARGWGLALCCLEGERLPHVIVARDLGNDGDATIKAYLTDEGYSLDAANGSNPQLARLLRSCVQRLNSTTAATRAQSGRVRSPRRSSGA